MPTILTSSHLATRHQEVRHCGKSAPIGRKKTCSPTQIPRREFMPNPSCTSPRRLALAVILLITFAVPLLVPSAFAQSGAQSSTSSGPTTVRRDLHHNVSPPLSEMIRNAPPPSLERREVEPLKPIPLPPGLSQNQEDPVR